jgi:CubicO group peptidase (beta-lactamase class C family)
MRSLFILFVILTLPGLLPAQTTPPAELRHLEAFIERGMRDWEIPGLAIAVVKDDELVWARGFGVRRLGETTPVDENTLFNIASVSKAFTAAALAILVDEGRIDWDDPVVDYIPHFQLYDPYVTQNTTIRDLLSHRVGIGRMTGNRLRWISHRDRDEQIRRIRHLGPEQPFRAGYVYNNVLYMVAGEIVPAVTGISWEEFVRDRIFKPLGMNRSFTSMAHLREGENIAFPHQEIDGKVVEIPRRSFDGVGPAASIHSSAQEIAAWIRLHLGDPGTFEGRRLLSRTVVQEMHRAQNVIREPAFSHLASYGLGWSLGSWQGRRVSSHGGAVDGMNTTLVLVPEENLGIFITTNAFNTFMNALAQQVMDAYFGAPERDWHETIFQNHQRQKAAVQARRDSIHAARIPNARTSLPLERFTGHYDDDLYADARVKLVDGRLVLELWKDDDQVADLEHWHHDTFRAIWRNRAMREEFVWFTRGPSGEIDALHIDWNLRPALLQVGAYPSSYRRVATFRRVEGPETPVQISQSGTDRNGVQPIGEKR